MKLIRIISGFCFCFVIIFSSFAHNANISNLKSDSSYTSVHYKGSATIILNEELQGCQYNVVSVIDSFLYVQLNIAGLEVGRALVTPDSILFINKLQKKFYHGDYSILEKFLDMEIDFFALQAVFNGIQTDAPEEVELVYQSDSLSYEYPFFNLFTFENFFLSFKLDVKKVTFNAAPEVSAVIPKNFTEIIND